MKLATPPGVRSCNEGGAWDICVGPDGQSWVLKELRVLVERLGPHGAALIKAELRDKMKRATMGALTYGEGPGGDVEQMAATWDILELRISAATGESGERLHVRLFFAEPEALPARMCALMLFWKRPGDVDLEEQSLAAQSASRRLHEWDAAGRPC